MNLAEVADEVAEYPLGGVTAALVGFGAAIEELREADNPDPAVVRFLARAEELTMQYIESL